MRRRWINFGSRPLVTTLVPQGTGTAIGGMTAQGGLAASVDGNTNQAFAAAAGSSGTPSGFVAGTSVGRDWGSGNTKLISRVVAYSPNNMSFIGSGVAINYRIYGHSANDPVAGTILASGVTGSGNAISIDVTSLTTTTAYRYHWLVLEGNGANDVGCAELIFYELV